MIIEVLRVRVNVHGLRKLTVYRQRTGTRLTVDLTQAVNLVGIREYGWYKAKGTFP